MTGLKFLHGAGFAHRDLKLENLLLSSDGVLKIADFGVTKDIKFNPMRTCCGSPDYIAPEIITDKNGYDGLLTDIWSCGVILYAMLAGEFPFENASHILRGLYKVPKWFPQVAKLSLLDKILVVDPKKRIQSCDAIVRTEWMQNFTAQRNAFAAYIDVKTQVDLVFICRSMRVCVYVYIRTIIHMHTNIHICMYTHMHAFIPAWNMCLYVCVYVCVCISVYKYD